MPTIGDRPASGCRLSCARLTAPQVNAVVTRREGRSGRGAETQLGALKIAQLLIDRQPSHGWERNSAFSILRSRTGHRIAVVRRMRGKSPDWDGARPNVRPRPIMPINSTPITP